MASVRSAVVQNKHMAVSPTDSRVIKVEHEAFDVVSEGVGVLDAFEETKD